MTLREKLGQLFFIGVSGKTLTSEESQFIVQSNIGGVILFGRNYESPKQVHALCQQIQALSSQQASKVPLFIGVDQEGGRVARFRAPMTVWPPVRRLGEKNDLTLTFEFAKAMGSELFHLGVNLNFAPCVDIFSNPLNTVIGDRSLGSDVEIVENHGSALVRGYIKSQILSCAKHFPGHGHTLLDSHFDLPVAEQTLSDLENFELKPFKKAMKAKVEMMMMAHILFKNIDPDWPATLSRKFVNDILKKELRFRGLVLTDDLGMKALSRFGDTGQIAVRALHVGIDMLLYCNEPEAPGIALQALEKAISNGQLDEGMIDLTLKKVLDFKQEQKDRLIQPPWSEAEKVIACEAHKLLAQKIAEA